MIALRSLSSRAKLGLQAWVAIAAVLFGGTFPCATVEHRGAHAHGFAGAAHHHETVSHHAGHSEDSHSAHPGEHSPASRQPCCHDNLLGVPTVASASQALIARASISAPDWAQAVEFATASGTLAPNQRFLFRVHPPRFPSVPVFLSTSSLLI